MGKVRLLCPGAFSEPPLRRLRKSDIPLELKRFQKALDDTRQELQNLLAKLEGESANPSREILEIHLLVLDDSYVNDGVHQFISENFEGAESAYYRVVKNCVDSFQQIPDAYMRERALDIKDVAQRVMRHLTGEHRYLEKAGEEPEICVALDPTPSETIQLDRVNILGFAIELGSPTSHTAILAKSLGLPAVIRLHGLCDELRNGDSILLDGYLGILILHPSEATLQRYEETKEATRKTEELLRASTLGPASTSDGYPVTIAANAEFTSELQDFPKFGAEGIGLFRTEFLYLENPNISEEAMYLVYKDVVDAAQGKLVIFRTLDIGGDKLEANLELEEIEQNPFLGWRGIRVSLDKPELFKRQLRAMLRASAAGHVGIMYPMISSVHEVQSANALLEECKQELQQQGVKIDPNLLRGAMIEVPSAAMIADLLAVHVDFFSIGTNDLVQYTMAVDRVNQKVADLYHPCNPAVLRLIQNTIKAAHHAGIWVGLCGEMASDPNLTPLLIGLGINELSTASPQVFRIKYAVKQLSKEKCTALAEAALQMDHSEQIWKLSSELAKQSYPELFAK